MQLTTSKYPVLCFNSLCAGKDGNFFNEKESVSDGQGEQERLREEETFGVKQNTVISNQFHRWYAQHPQIKRLAHIRTA